MYGRQNRFAQVNDQAQAFGKMLINLNLFVGVVAVIVLLYIAEQAKKELKKYDSGWVNTKGYVYVSSETVIVQNDASGGDGDESESESEEENEDGGDGDVTETIMVRVPIPDDLCKSVSSNCGEGNRNSSKRECTEYNCDSITLHYDIPGDESESEDGDEEGENAIPEKYKYTLSTKQDLIRIHKQTSKVYANLHVKTENGQHTSSKDNVKSGTLEDAKRKINTLVKFLQFIAFIVGLFTVILFMVRNNPWVKRIYAFDFFF